MTLPEPYYERDGIMIYVGDNSEILPRLDTESVSAVVSDPPSGISFMNANWDSHKGGRDQWIAWLASVLSECKRVMLPGAHALIWALPRTSGWTSMAIEDAGLDVRDCITHLFGTGFPKSADVSKHIDKMAGAEREVVGERVRLGDKRAYPHNATSQIYGKDNDHLRDGMRPPETAPATPEAEQWQGWGTALKPGYESWYLAQKPVSVRAICGMITPTIKELLCQLRSHVKGADGSSQSNQSVSDGASVSALWNAVEESNTPGDLYGLMDTWQSELVTISSSNIAWSWLLILSALWKRENTFTTETESSLITDLKTLNSLLSTITPADIIRAETQPNGDASSVWAVDAIFRSAYAKSNITPSISVGTHATPKVGETGFSPDLNFWYLARKPFKGTVAAQVLATGTGAINVDACRIGTSGGTTKGSPPKGKSHGIYGDGINGACDIVDIGAGRWPSNVLLDEEAAEMLDAMSGVSTSAKGIQKYKRAATSGWRESKGMHTEGREWEGVNYGDTGGASRFFKVVEQDCLSTYNVEEQECASCGEESTEAENTSAGKRTASSEGNSPTDGCGSKQTGLSQTGTKSTTSTTINSTTSCPTCNVSPQSGTTTTTNDCGKITETSTELNIDAASDVTNTSHSPSSSGASQEPIRGTASHASANTCESGEPQTANTTTPTCVNTESAITGSRFFYVAKASRRERNAGLPEGETSSHPTVKPLALMRYLIQMVTPPGGIVLDPFMGSGSTLVAAAELGFHAIGIELSEEYAEIAARRVDHALNERARRLPGLEALS